MPTEEKEIVTPLPAGTPQPAHLSEPREAKNSDKDIGEWKYEPWSGLARWVNPQTREESFDEKYVRKLAKKSK